MPRAEVGTTKHLANSMKAKGLQRLRWYCQVCERQMRDENGFKQHTMSEGHVRQMLVVGQSSQKYVAEYTRQFTHDFLQLLRTSHGTKSVNANHFYQEYIANKEHVHQNATRFHSLTEFVKHLGREGICRVDLEGEKGMEIAWIDNSPENLRRQDALRKKERMEKGDEERERRLIAEQVERARRDAEEKEGDEEDEDEEERTALQREEGQKIKLSFGAKKEKEKEKEPGVKMEEDKQPSIQPDEPNALKQEDGSGPVKAEAANGEPLAPSPSHATSNSATPAPEEKPKVSLSMSGSKPKNVFAAVGKKNALNGSKTAPKLAQQRPMSEAERIMKEEIERKRKRESMGFSGGGKKMRA